MTLQRKIKENALLSLKNHWGRALGILFFQLGVHVFFLLLEQLLCGILDLTSPESPALQISWANGLIVDGRLAIVTGTALLIGVAVLTPIGMGVKRWYCEHVTGEYPSILTIFAYFYNWKTLFRVILLRIIVGVRKLLWAIPFAVLPVLLWGGLSFVRADSGVALVMKASGMILVGIVALLMWVLWYFVTLRYYLADYLFIRNEGMGLHQIVRSSVRAMKGGKRALFSLQLSMLPWWLLSILIVPAIFLAPYYMASTALFSVVRIEGYQRKIAEK